MIKAAARTAIAAVVIALEPAGSHSLAADAGQARQPYDHDACPDSTDPWWCSYEQEGFLSASWVLDDDHLVGAALGYGTRGYWLEGLRSKTWSAAYQSHGHDSVWGVRRDWALALYGRRWGGLGPLVAFGLESRDGSLHPGFGGYIGLGGHITFWTRGHWQFAIGAEHDFGVSSESRNAVQATVAFAHPKLGATPRQ